MTLNTYRTASGYAFLNDVGLFSMDTATGFVSSWRAGDTLLARRAPGFVSANDPACGGLLVPAWHHFRANGEPNIWNRGWEINPLRAGKFGAENGRCVMEPNRNRAGDYRVSFEVDFRDHYGPVMRVRHDYTISPTKLTCWVTFATTWNGSSFPAFVKEPKLVCSFRAPFQQASVYDSAGRLLGRHDLTKITDPAVHSEQLRSALRRRVRLTPGGIVVAGYSAQGGRRTPTGWVGSGLGLDGWAVASNGRRPFEPGHDAAYCAQGPGGTLTRNWEIAKRGTDQVSLMLHAWEGGSGLPDCLGCARALRPGDSWTAYVTISGLPAPTAPPPSRPTPRDGGGR
jgi:hypothetical protein